MNTAAQIVKTPTVMYPRLPNLFLLKIINDATIINISGGKATKSQYG
jgi:hypothetical protein